MRTTKTLGMALVATILLVGGVPLDRAATAIESPGLRMEILVDGVPLSEYHARGTTYVEAQRGAEYSVRLYNDSDRRVAVALAVDGLNSIDAKSGPARRASKWVLDPWQTVTVDGWQTSSASARRFYFTTEPDSYGAWLGRTANLGVVEAVVFREKPRPEPVLRYSHPRPAPSGPSGAPQEGAAAPGPSREKTELGQRDESDDLAATGIGREVDNRVYRVDLELESRPSASVRIRYEYRPQLVALGVLPRFDDGLWRREHARGFSDSDFAPDPYRGEQ